MKNMTYEEKRDRVYYLQDEIPNMITKAKLKYANDDKYFMSWIDYDKITSLKWELNNLKKELGMIPKLI